MRTGMRHFVKGVFLVAAFLAPALPFRAFAFSVSPAVVNIATFGPSTVFLSYRNFTGFTPDEALWCNARLTTSRGYTVAPSIVPRNSSS